MVHSIFSSSWVRTQVNVSSSPLNKATVDCWGEDDGTKENQVDTYKVKHWATLSASVSSCAMLLVIRHKGGFLDIC